MGDTVIATDVLAGISDAAAELGKSVTLRVWTETANWVDANAPSKGKVRTYSDKTATAIIVDFKEKQIDGDIVKRGDKQAIVSLSGLGATPAVADQLIDGSVTWEILNVETPEIAGVAVTSILHLRK